MERLVIYEVMFPFSPLEDRFLSKKFKKFLNDFGLLLKKLKVVLKGLILGDKLVIIISNNWHKLTRL